MFFSYLLLVLLVSDCRHGGTTGSIWAEPGSTAITGSLDEGISKNELGGAARLGERVALLAKKMN